MENKNLKQYDAMYSLPFIWWVKKKFLREWHELLFKLRFKKRKVEHLGLTLTIPLTSWMGKYLVVPNEFFMSKTIHAALLMKPGVAIDIGTHAGEFLIRYKAACKSLNISDGTYYGFEPNHASFSFINELIRANNWPNTHVFPVAFAESTGLRNFYASQYADPCASLHQEINQGTSGFNSLVPTFEGNEFLGQLDIENIAIIKIDAEGAELDILKGLKNTIEQYRPCIHCEMANIPESEEDPNYQFIVDNNREVIEVMLDMDYQTYAIVEDGNCYHHVLKYRGYLPHLDGPVEIENIPKGGNYIMAHKDDMPKLLSLMVPE